MAGKEKVIEGDRIGTIRMTSVVLVLHAGNTVKADVVNHIAGVTKRIKGQIIKVHANDAINKYFEIKIEMK